jgi:signal transduction histidine kinase
MNETAAMLETRLALIDRIRRVEHSLARDEQAHEAARLLRGRMHDLGNAIQIVRLASIEIEKRGTAGLGDLVRDLRNAAEQAASALGNLIAASKPVVPTEAGAAIAPVVRAAAELARPSVGAPIDVRIELADLVRTSATADELEAIVLAAVLDASNATKIWLELRVRAIEGKPWIELLRIDDRRTISDVDLAHAFEPFVGPGPGLHLVRALAERVGGEVSLSAGRVGPELVVALPVAAG